MSRDNPRSPEWARWYQKNPNVIANWAESSGRQPPPEGEPLPDQPMFEVVAEGHVTVVEQAPPANRMPDVGQIIAYEQGELGAQETVELFAGLVASGLAWSLQGSYGRMAMAFIEHEVISREGVINQAQVDAALGQ